MVWEFVRRVTALVGAGLVWADGTSEVVVTDEGNAQTALITFEGLVAETEIGLVAEAGADFSGWSARVRDGYVDPPTAPTVAIFSTIPGGVVTFDPPVSGRPQETARKYDQTHLRCQPP